MPRRPPLRSAHKAPLGVGLGLVLGLLACGGKLRGGPDLVPDDASTQGPYDGADAAGSPLTPGKDGATAPDAPLTDSAVAVVPLDDASLLPVPALDGAIDPNGPCPAVTAGLRCSSEGAHLCGAGCSLQCSCAGGSWLCHLPPC
jgi:hypothetical protein